MRLLIPPRLDSSDLLEVWRLFFSSNGPDAQQNRRQACDIVKIWQHRRANKIPHQIVSTSMLINAQLNDRNPSVSDESVCSVHAMALLSFVTGMADIKQTKEHKVSMFEVAKAIGLPIKLVEIRHFIVHQGLPNLAVLREATEEALEWLRTEYWAKIVSSENSKAISEGCKI